MILDIHSHRLPPYPEGIVSLRDIGTTLAEGQLYSAGIHPWDTPGEVSEETFAGLERLAENPQVVAIGECGVDLLKGAPLFRQLNILKRQVDISEKVRKPLILHCVKGADIILGLRRDLRPAMPWVIHGFRGKPELAAQLLRQGILLSFGEKFNADTLIAMPDDMILAETDESILTIEEIIGALSETTNRDLRPAILSNIASIFPLKVDF